MERGKETILLCSDCGFMLKVTPGVPNKDLVYHANYHKLTWPRLLTPADPSENYCWIELG